VSGARDWDWGFPDGHSDGRPTTYKTETEDGYSIAVTLQENADGVLICSGLNIQFNQKEKNPPLNPINSRYFQLLGFGEILSSVRKHYLEWGEELNSIYTEIDIEKTIKDWTGLGPLGFPDEKYAAVAYMYVKFVKQGLENPITALAEYWECDKNTASSRVLEARNRGLLTKPVAGNFGGKLTPLAEKLLGLKKTGKKK
jgi:hypothetical protein